MPTALKSRGHYRRAISEYMAHDHHKRYRQRLGNDLIQDEAQDMPEAARSFVGAARQTVEFLLPARAS